MVHSPVLQLAHLCTPNAGASQSVQQAPRECSKLPERPLAPGCFQPQLTVATSPVQGQAGGVPPQHLVAHPLCLHRRNPSAKRCDSLRRQGTPCSRQGGLHGTPVIQPAHHTCSAAAHCPVPQPHLRRVVCRAREVALADLPILLLNLLGDVVNNVLILPIIHQVLAGHLQQIADVPTFATNGRATSDKRRAACAK